MKASSAGLLLFRRTPAVEVLIVHPGGPFWARKDLGAWTIPKGLLEPTEEPLRGAIREFVEETGFDVEGPFLDLGTIRQKGGKTVHGFAAEGDADPEELESNEIEIEWPPRSGVLRLVPEVDRAAWCTIELARTRLNPAQSPFLDRLLAGLP